MAVITTTPVQDSTDPQYRQAGGTNFGELNPFYFHVGDQLYQLLAAVQDTAKRIGMFKRAVSDIQGTWANQPNGLDDTNAPDSGSQSGRLQVFDDTANSGKIAVLYLLTDLTSLKIVEFDTATDTWGTPTAAVTVANVTQKWGFTRRSDGTYVVIGTRTGHLYYILNTAGTWGSIIDTSLAATATVLAGDLIDASDNSFVLLNETGNAMSIRHLDSSNTLSSGITITTTRSNFAGRSAMCFYGASGIAVGFVPSAGGNAGDAVVSIAPVATAPVFTDYNIYHTTGPFNNETASYITPVLGMDGITLNVFFVALDNDVPEDQMMQSIFDGVSTWSTPIVFYDEITNPPVNGLTPPGNVLQFVHTIQAIELPQGWTAATAMETLVDGDQWCTGFFLEPGSPPPSQSLRLTKTVSGGTALPAMWLLTGTGTTQTVSGAGDTGVVAVIDPQTFQLAETTGPDGYTAGQWDCGAAVMPSPTSVIVDDSGGTTISATQVSADPTFKTLLSGGDSEFTVGSDQYRVMFNSANRLGMFKRATASIGGAWTEMDSAHAPTGQSGYGKSLVDGTVIAVCFLPTGNTTAKIVEFNTATDLWGIPTAAVTLLSSLATFAFVRRSDNTYVVIAGRPNTIYRITNTGGTWSAITVMASLASGVTVIGGVIDSSDRIWALINTASTTVGIYSISASYVLGSAITSVSVLFGGPYPYLYYPQISLWGADAVAVSWNTALTIGGAGTISVKTITPLAAPVVTTSVAYTFGAGTERAYLFQPVDDGAGNLNLFLIDTDTGVNKILQALFDGISNWGATSTFYDAFVDPPPSGIVPSDITALQAKLLGSGWTAAVTMQTTGPTSTGEFIESVTPTGVVVCTITNTFGAPPFSAQCPSPIYVVGTPYSSFVTVSGGVAPYTFAVHSGSLPTGLSLDASTGEISGTPSADGPFTFVIRVTDDDGAIADTGSCSAGRCPGTLSLL